MALTEGYHAASFLLGDVDPMLSIDNATLLSGENVKAGTVLGTVTVGAASSAAFSGNTGNGTMGTVTLSAGAKSGVYKLTIVEPAANAGAFVVEDPEGVQIGHGTVAVAFSAGGLAFTLADGATDFVAGDGFNITVAAGSGKLRAYATANADGSQIPTSIAYADCDASAGDAPIAVVTRQCPVNGKVLTYPSGQLAAVTAGLLAVGIIVR